MFNVKIIGIVAAIVTMISSPFSIWLAHDGQASLEKAKKQLNKDNFESMQIELYTTSTGEIVTLDFEEYICGVLLAEVPEYFEDEAMKAMAVAARTYCFRRLSSDAKYTKHYSADVCDDYTHCLGYISPDEAAVKWGEKAALEYYEKIKNNVEQTKGEILLYQDNVIDAVFHASSCDYTESAENIWGYEIPYLVSVSTPEQAALSYAEYTPEELKNILNQEGIRCNFSLETSKWLTEIKTDKNGRVEYINICNTQITGRRVREIFGLKSTNFDINFENEKFKFTAKGNGHGVGLSQYGAQQFAKSGVKYKDILSHYYKNTELGLCQNNITSG